MRRRYLTVPYDETGVQAYLGGDDDSSHMYTEILPEEEYSVLLQYFANMNRECGLMIDDCESEMIFAVHLPVCRRIIESSNAHTPVFMAALDMAIAYQTMLALDF